MFDSLRQGLILRARLASDFLQSSCLTLLSGRITGRNYHTTPCSFKNSNQITSFVYLSGNLRKTFRYEFSLSQSQNLKP